MTEPQPLEYRSAGSVPSRQVFSVTAFLTVGIPLFFLFVVMIFVVPKFETIFKDFGTKLPAVTQLLLDIARFFANAWIWIVLVLLPPAAGFLIPLLVQPDPRSLRQRRIIALLMVITALLFMLLIIGIALVLPMFALIQNISGK